MQPISACLARATLLAAAVVSASFVSLVDLGTVRQASAQVEANSKSVVITLPPATSCPGGSIATHLAQ